VAKWKNGLPLPLTLPSNGKQFEKFTAVVIRDLKSKPHLNGKHAILKEYTESKGRYVVEVTKEEVLSLQPNNFKCLCVEAVTTARYQKR